MYDKEFEIRKQWALVALVTLSTLAFATAEAINGLGCLYDDTICSDEEYCLNDGLFGSCRSSSELADWLSTETVNPRILEELLADLWKDGYRWEDEYTQCVISCLLENAREGLDYDPTCCTHTLKLTEPVTSNDIVSSPSQPQLSNVDPADQAYIRYTPNLSAGELGVESRRNDGETYADEVFVPPMSTSTSIMGEGQDPERQLRGLGAIAAFTDQANELRRTLRKRQLELFDKDQEEQDEGGEEDEDPLAKVIQDNLWATGSSNDDLGEVRDSSFIDNLKPIRKGSFLEDDEPELRDTSTLQQLASLVDREFEEENRRSVDSKEQQNGEPGVSDEAVTYELEELAPDNSVFVDKIKIRADPFRRPMRLDTKKPGPGYFYREFDDEEDVDKYTQKLRRLKAMREMKSELLHEVDNPEDISNDFGEDLTLFARLIGPFPPIPFRAVPRRGHLMLIENAPIQALFLVKVDGLQNGGKKRAEIPDETLSRIPVRQAEGMMMLDPYSTAAGIEPVDSSTAYVSIERVDKSTVTKEDASRLTITLEKLFELPTGTISQSRLSGDQVAFKVLPNEKGINATEMINRLDKLKQEVRDKTNLTISRAGIGDGVKYELIAPRNGDLFLFSFVVCGSVVGVLLAISVIYVVRRHQLSKEKLHNLNGEDDPLAKFDYQDLCRQRMADSGKESPLAAALESGKLQGSPKKVKIVSQQSDSSRSSTSSWSEEPVATSMDISTGHMILSYMEDHIKSKNRLEEEWESLCAYEADPSSTAQAEKQENIKKNRYPDTLPYDHSRVILNDASNPNGSDYVNASAITDHDPGNPAYIATQGPLAHTAADFWQMVWEQGGVVVVTLTRLMENGVSMCHRYWPEEGSESYGLYEVHLVSEHVWCDDYLVRSFYLKNLKTSETRTVTQFHFLSWPENGIPPSTKSLLDFRRKVNRSYRGRSCPIVVHCSDGSGRTGTYVLMDMVLNRIAKGAKEIDVAATLEHVRDQRVNMVKTKAQFEFVLMAVAEEVHAILKSLPKE
ncbi:receptor-type tyrosine-protein phosphatase N2 [Galendromus occidentalis]|uniref:Receptor-type tyrosine-protein phosphatase N2 n=1 Tax=Galendromus occidentalis TaxID=34638 RepID=A0AAJ6VXE1_9ACAR|nr:receptor-type tyrosine-protein phosphatase N2 [Galendromus occidentalis]